MYILGIDIGGTTCGVCIGDSNGHLIEQVQFATNPADGAEPALSAIIKNGQQLISRFSHDIDAVGISCGSPIDHASGHIAFTEQLASWRGINLQQRMETAFNLPVMIENDANAGALAEFYFGAGRGCRHMAFLTFGTGLGAGFILNGQLYSGVNGYAGEIAHMRLSTDGPCAAGKRGSFEAFCSGHGIAKLSEILLAESEHVSTLVSPGMSCREIAAAARAGDVFARAVFACSGRRLGEGLALINDALNLERIVIGSVFVRCEDLMRPAMEQRLSEEAVAASLQYLQILPSALGEDIGFYAALAVAAQVVPA